MTCKRRVCKGKVWLTLSQEQTHQQQETGGWPSQMPSERPYAGPWRWMAMPASRSGARQSPGTMFQRRSCLLDGRPVRNPPADAHSLVLKLIHNGIDPVISLTAAAGILCVKKNRVSTSRCVTLKHISMEVNLPEKRGQLHITIQSMPFSCSMMQGQTSEYQLLHPSEWAKRRHVAFKGYRLLAHLLGCLLVEALVCDGAVRHFCLYLT